MSRRPLQVATAVVAAIPVTTGGLALFYGVRSPLYQVAGDCVTPLLDSNFRFLAGLWVGVGLAACWLIPRIERETTLFRAIWVAIFLGGVGRLVSLAALGRLPPVFAAFMFVELLGAPLFIYWQHRVAGATNAVAGSRSSAPTSPFPPPVP
jgi:hypothetical protein